jgi:hypothetical protein
MTLHGCFQHPHSERKLVLHGFVIGVGFSRIGVVMASEDAEVGDAFQAELTAGNGESGHLQEVPARSCTRFLQCERCQKSDGELKR